MKDFTNHKKLLPAETLQIPARGGFLSTILR
jgi:hypothetical protein